MRKPLALLGAFAALTLILGTTSALAKDKEVTLTGEAQCAHCIMHEGTSCKTVIETTKDGKKTDYYVVSNDISKGYKADVCSAPHKVTVTGTVKKEDGKHMLTLTKIEPAK